MAAWASAAPPSTVCSLLGSASVVWKGVRRRNHERPYTRSRHRRDGKDGQASETALRRDPADTGCRGQSREVCDHEAQGVRGRTSTFMVTPRAWMTLLMSSLVVPPCFRNWLARTTMPLGPKSLVKPNGTNTHRRSLHEEGVEHDVGERPTVSVRPPLSQSAKRSCQHVHIDAHVRSPPF